MDFEFKKLLPIPVRTESAPKPLGEEIFKMPGWRCYCCHDTGWVQPHLAKLFIAEYDSNRDKTPVCQACDKGRQWYHLKGNIDTRIDQVDCKNLDIYERRNWEETTRLQFEGLQKNKQLIDETLSQLAMRKSLRKRTRTIEEESIAKYKHELESSDRYDVVQEEHHEEA